MNAPIIELDTIDSTNNYAMWLIDADTAQAGLTIVTKLQTNGKGQRGKQWVDTPGESLLMSIVLAPVYKIERQFSFNVAISLAIADVLQEIYENWDIRIKWPNDIIINDKKAGGILIENVIRGSEWVYSVVGLGINVLQMKMPEELPHATSLFRESGRTMQLNDLMQRIRERIINYTTEEISAHRLMKQYNDSLYRKGMVQRFILGKNEFSAQVNEVTPDGLLQLSLADGNIVNYSHGALEWYWG